MKTLKVGFVGSGFIAQFQLAAMAQVRNMELAGIVKRTGSDRLAAQAVEYGVGSPKIYASVREMAAHVDAIAIYVPNFATLEVMEEVAAAKKAGANLVGVICEKPLGRNLREARRFVELARDADLRTAYFENQIHMKSVQTQLKQLEPQQKTMGPLSLSRSSEEHGGPHMPWFWDPTKQGGGVLLDMGCHSVAVGWYVLTPTGRPLTYLKPQSVLCDIGLLKWGEKPWREKLLREKGIDFKRHPAEDFATGVITYKNPETGQIVKSQFTDSWMFEKQGLRLFMDGTGPGYAFEINTLVSPLNVFVGDEAAAAIADQEKALEKATASRGLLSVQYNEADLYGYTDENRDAATKFLSGQDAYLPFSYGVEIMRLLMAAYMSAERRKSIDLTDPQILDELETFTPAVQKGEGASLFSTCS